ncbi:hypothetical protein Bca4012_037765 [Brassica carinata]
MLGKCGSEVIHLSKELESSQEALKRTEAALQTVEDTHAAQTSQLEVCISDLDCDLGKTASSLPKVKRDLALAGIEGSLRELELLRGNEAPSLDSEEARLSSYKGEWATSEGDFDSIHAGLQAECSLAPSSEDSEDQERAGEDCEAGADEAGSCGAIEGGDGEAVPIAGEFEDEGDAPGSV